MIRQRHFCHTLEHTLFSLPSIAQAVYIVPFGMSLDAPVCRILVLVYALSYFHAEIKYYANKLCYARLLLVLHFYILSSSIRLASEICHANQIFIKCAQNWPLAISGHIFRYTVNFILQKS